uniref:GIY-YIG catalytic domain protein n=1 Tax=Pithovirus LCPAC101 TaxID=2506586 RepID=A0A481Z3Z3_9VIRU|nr:MAG: GIY-YIG catalytic domain protein [Pithovirus LCPAC101]
MSSPPEKQYYVYLLQSINNTRRTYIGYTVNPTRRLRQHNREIKGGALKTSKFYPWEIICYITGFQDSRTALQFEWCNNHPKKMGLTKRCGKNGRIKTLHQALCKRRFASTSPLTKNMKLEWHWFIEDHKMPTKLEYVDEIEYIDNRKNNL